MRCDKERHGGEKDLVVADTADQHLPRLAKLIAVEVEPRALPVLFRHLRPQRPANIGWCMRQVLLLDDETGFRPALHPVPNRAGLTAVVPAPHV